MRHARLLIGLCIVVVLAFATMCGRALFSVNDVNVDYSVYSNDECVAVQTILSNYEKKFMPFVNTQKIINEINEKTKLKVISVEKDYPSTLKVVVAERKESFAIACQDGYYILDSEYTVIECRDNYVNSADGLNNILLKFPQGMLGDDFSNRSKIEVKNQTLFNSIVEMVNSFNSPRDYVNSIRIEEKEVDENYYVYFTTIEGVEIEIRKALESPKSKIECGIEKYLSLTDEDRLLAKIAVYELDSGEIRAVFTTIDNQ